MSVLEGLRAFAGIGHDEHGIGIGQCQSKEGGFDELSGHFHQGKTEVNLGLSRRMYQGDKHLPATSLQFSDCIGDLCIATLIARLPQSLENPFRRMTLLAG